MVILLNKTIAKLDTYIGITELSAFSLNKSNTGAFTRKSNCPGCACSTHTHQTNVQPVLDCSTLPYVPSPSCLHNSQ